MKENQFESLSIATTALKNTGYNLTFRLENGSLKANETGNTYSAKEIEVENFHRFEGVTNPADMSILYAVRTNDGERGLIVAPYGPYGDTEIAEFMKVVEIEN